MANISFKALLSKAKERDEYWVAKAIQDFTEDLYRLMEQREVNKAELARRIDSTPAYVTKALRGNSNFTLESMVRLVRALDGQLCVHVTRREDSVRWLDAIGTKAPVQEPPKGEFKVVMKKALKAHTNRSSGNEQTPVAA